MFPIGIFVIALLITWVIYIRTVERVLNVFDIASSNLLLFQIFYGAALLIIISAALFTISSAAQRLFSPSPPTTPTTTVEFVDVEATRQVLATQSMIVQATSTALAIEKSKATATMEAHIRETSTAQAKPEATATPTVIPSPTDTLPLPPTATDTEIPVLTPTPFVSFDIGPVELRSGPGEAYPVIATLGDPSISLTVIGRTADGTWLLICCMSEMPLWVAVKQVTVYSDISGVPESTALPQPTPTNTNTPTVTHTPAVTPTPFVSIDTGFVELRTGPGNLYPATAKLGPGFPFTVVGRNADGAWLLICCVSEQRLWVVAAQVVIHNDISGVPEATAPPTPTPTDTPTPTSTPTALATPTPTDTLTATPVSSNIAPLATVSASSFAEASKDTCQPPHITSFQPTNLVDGQLTTAWRVKGDPTQDYVLFEFTRTAILREVNMVPGYAKADACTPSLNWCMINRIPMTVRLIFDDGSNMTFNLKRACEWQDFSFEPVETKTIRLTILDTYPALDPKQQRDFTPISEIRLVGYLR